jgi:hypothetical protein
MTNILQRINFILGEEMGAASTTGASGGVTTANIAPNLAKGHVTVVGAGKKRKKKLLKKTPMETRTTSP